MFTNKLNVPYEEVSVHTLEEAKRKFAKFQHHHVHLKVSFPETKADLLIQNEEEKFNFFPPVCQNIKISLHTPRHYKTKIQKRRAAKWILNWQKWVQRTLIMKVNTREGREAYMSTNVGVRTIQMVFNKEHYKHLPPEGDTEERSIRQMQKKINQPNEKNLDTKIGPLMVVNLFAEDNVEMDMNPNVWQTQCFFALNDEYAQKIKKRVLWCKPNKEKNHYGAAALQMAPHVMEWAAQIKNTLGRNEQIQELFDRYSAFVVDETIEAFRNLQQYLNRIAGNIEHEEKEQGETTMQEQCKRLVKTNRMKQAAKTCINILEEKPKLRLPLYMFGAITFLIYQKENPLVVEGRHKTYFTNENNAGAVHTRAQGVSDPEYEWEKQRQKWADQSCTNLWLHIYAPKDEEHAKEEIRALKTFRNFAPPVVQKITIALRENKDGKKLDNQTYAKWMVAWAKWMTDNLITTITYRRKKMVMPTNVGTTSIELKHNIKEWDPHKAKLDEMDEWKVVKTAMFDVNTPDQKTHRKSATLQQFRIDLTKYKTNGKPVRDEMPKAMWYQQCLFAINDIVHDYFGDLCDSEKVFTFSPKIKCSDMAKIEMTNKPDHNYTAFKQCTREDIREMQNFLTREFPEKDKAIFYLHEFWKMYEILCTPWDTPIDDEAYDRKLLKLGLSTEMHANPSTDPPERPQEENNNIYDFVTLHEYIQTMFEHFFQDIVQQIPQHAQDKFLEVQTRQIMAKEVGQVIAIFGKRILISQEIDETDLDDFKWPLYTISMSILFYHMYTRLTDVTNVSSGDNRN